MIGSSVPKIRTVLTHVHASQCSRSATPHVASSKKTTAVLRENLGIRASLLMPMAASASGQVGNALSPVAGSYSTILRRESEYCAQKRRADGLPRPSTITHLQGHPQNTLVLAGHLGADVAITVFGQLVASYQPCLPKLGSASGAPPFKGTSTFEPVVVGARALSRTSWAIRDHSRAIPPPHHPNIDSHPLFSPHLFPTTASVSQAPSTECL